MAHQQLESILLNGGCATFAHVKQLHAHLVSTGLLHSAPSFRSKLLDAAALLPHHTHHPSLPHAAAILSSLPFPATNDFNALLRGHALSPHPLPALRLYLLMLRSPHRPRPDALTISFALQACARLSSLHVSLQLHAHLLRFGLQADCILLTTLLDAYAKSSAVDLAERVFDEMTKRDVATWNAMIAGLANGGRAHDALRLFVRMRSPESPERPNGVTVVAALSACAQLGAVREGGEVDAFARAEGLDGDVRVRNALVDMYAKCGAAERAVEVFRDTPRKTLVSWNAVIMGLAMHGRGAEALRLFDEMASSASGVEPDAVTYLAVLCGCNHAGLVDEGLRVFHAMRVSPNIKHYGCIIDLLGRAGRLSEAYNAVTSMPLEPDVVLWQTLLGACKTYGNVAMAELVSQKLSEMGSNGCGDYVLLSNVYAAKERWSDVGRVREEMRTRDVRKVPGFSFIELNGTVHKFLNGDKSHERWREIYRKLDQIAVRITALGYLPETTNVLHDIGEEDKQNALYYHSEKLAIAFGLMNTAEGEEIQVIKNLRICGDCHVVAKLISQAYDRVITVRDRARFHRFKGGNCSCRDYW